MGNNISQYYPFATAQGANVYPASVYAALTALQQGVQNGIGDPTLANTTWRQATVVASMIGRFTADYGPNNILDDGNVSGLEENFVAALTAMFEGVQFLQDVGTANAIAVNPHNAVAALSTNCVYIIRVAAANIVGINQGATTISVSGLAPVPLLTPDLQQLLPSTLYVNGLIVVAYDGQQRFQLLSEAPISPNVIIHYGQDISTVANEVIFATDASVIALTTPMLFMVPIAITNTSTSVIANPNGLGWTPITRGAGGALTIGDLVAGTDAFLCFTNGNLQLLNPQQLGASTSGAPANWNNIAGQIRPYWIAVNSATTSAPPGSPSTSDTYLIPAVGASGSWVGQGGSVAQWTGSAWVFATYPNGSITTAYDTMQVYMNTVTGWLGRELPSSGRLHYFANQ